MGYDVHITRKRDRFDKDQPGIAFEEWSSYIDGDPSMRMDDVARMTAPSGDVIEVKNPGFAMWTAYSGHEEDRIAWFNWSRSGNIYVKNPDTEILGKMLQIGRALGAKVQGDEGEIYRADGSVERPD